MRPSIARANEQLDTR